MHKRPRSAPNGAFPPPTVDGAESAARTHRSFASRIQARPARATRRASPRLALRLSYTHYTSTQEALGEGNWGFQPRRSYHNAAAPKPLAILPLVALIFYEVSGGPFGTEDAVRAGSPFVALLGESGELLRIARHTHALRQPRPCPENKQTCSELPSPSSRSLSPLISLRIAHPNRRTSPPHPTFRAPHRPPQDSFPYPPTPAAFAIFPLIWSIPEALVCAEMATIFPENSGYVAWVTAAFGPFWGWMEGFWSWVSGVTDNSVYPVLFMSYLGEFRDGW